MKRALTKSNCNVWWVDNGVLREGYPPDVRGNLDNVSGNLSNVSGNLSGVSGDLSNVRGDLDDCDLTDDDRRLGVDVADLIVQTPGGEG